MTLTIALVLTATALFFLAFNKSNVVELSTRVVRESAVAFKVMSDKTLDDDAKEIAMQETSIAMLKLGASVLGRVAVICALPVTLLAIAVAGGWTSESAIWQVSLSWPFIALNMAVFIAILIWQRQR